MARNVGTGVGVVAISAEIGLTVPTWGAFAGGAYLVPAAVALIAGSRFIGTVFAVPGGR